ncbi:MAG: hypothetical protein QOH70_3409 [Blastocatellia bacterium]|jgi:hypothetical protein|nr:hypothetical protein [Blastocatellia bacterium]
MLDEKYKDGNEGKCRYCGFLSKHGTQTAGIPSPRFYEVEHSERIAGSFFTHTASNGLATNSEPMCFLDKINFMQIELHQGRQKLLEAINSDPKCGEWYPYMPGLSPQEHYDMRSREQFERALDAERDMRERSYRRQDRYFLWASVILGAAQIIAAIILSIILNYHESYTDRLLKSIFGPLK